MDEDATFRMLRRVSFWTVTEMLKECPDFRYLHWTIKYNIPVVYQVSRAFLAELTNAGWTFDEYKAELITIYNERSDKTFRVNKIITGHDVL